MDLDFEMNSHKVTWNITNSLLTKGESNVKINKSEKHGVYSTMILHLAPSDMSGVNVCPNASEGCKKICLAFSGHAGMVPGGMVDDSNIHKSSIHRARVGRTILFKKNQTLFFKKLVHEINGFLINCEMKGTKPAMRLNGTSDIAWEKIKVLDTGKSIIELFPMIQFYDYTKDIKRAISQIPQNYFLIFSRSENNDDKVIKALENGVNVAVVFDKVLPETYRGYRVISGELTDLRFLDNIEFDNNTGKGVIVGLVAKGYRAKRDDSGFVVKEQATIQMVA